MPGAVEMPFRFIAMLPLLLFITVPCETAQFNDRGKTAVVEYHNKIRSEVTIGKFVTKRNTKRPHGANMEKMYWNSSLAASAEAYAHTDPSTHSHSSGIGENLYWHWATRPGDLNKYGRMAAESWIHEFKTMHWDTTILTNELFNSGVGHATQMVWAETNQIGCAYATFQEKHKKTGREIMKISVVCHYWPKGNYLNEPIYLEGKPCSKCKQTKCERNTQLCV